GHLSLPSFPTRRSSDLILALPRGSQESGAATPGSTEERFLPPGGARTVLPPWRERRRHALGPPGGACSQQGLVAPDVSCLEDPRSEEHTSELQSLTNLL